MDDNIEKKNYNEMLLKTQKRVYMNPYTLSLYIQFLLLFCVVADA